MFYGVDGCRSGWCLAMVDSGGACGLAVLPTFAKVAYRVQEPKTVSVDMPIGLADGITVHRRLCDSLAMQALGRLGSSVFPVAVTPALQAQSYEDANCLQREATGTGLSHQSWARDERTV